jgi:hypothetical protein
MLALRPQQTTPYSLTTAGFLTICFSYLCNNHFKLEASWMQKAALVAANGGGEGGRGRCCADFDLMPTTLIFCVTSFPFRERPARKYP